MGHMMTIDISTVKPEAGLCGRGVDVSTDLVLHLKTLRVQCVTLHDQVYGDF